MKDDLAERRIFYIYELNNSFQLLIWDRIIKRHSVIWIAKKKGGRP